jgi:hypothetical protein
MSESSVTFLIRSSRDICSTVHNPYIAATARDGLEGKPVDSSRSRRRKAGEDKWQCPFDNERTRAWTAILISSCLGAAPVTSLLPRIRTCRNSVYVIYASSACGIYAITYK